jgi:hypothetical protein
MDHGRWKQQAAKRQPIRAADKDKKGDGGVSGVGFATSRRRQPAEGVILPPPTTTTFSTYRLKVTFRCFLPIL